MRSLGRGLRGGRLHDAHAWVQDDPETVEEANSYPEVFTHKTVKQVADHFRRRDQWADQASAPDGARPTSRPIPSVRHRSPDPWPRTRWPRPHLLGVNRGERRWTDRAPLPRWESRVRIPSSAPEESKPGLLIRA